MKIAIVGAGWVGCHLAYKLKEFHNITIYEKNENLFTESSYFNQNRLHRGYHYARSYETRNLCNDTYSRFVQEYGFLTKIIPNNIYCVPKSNSLIDYKTYLKIFEGFNYTPVELKTLRNIEGAINTDERYIDCFEAHDFFNRELKSITKKVHVDDIRELAKEYDLVINCTNNHIKDPESDTAFYELTQTLVYSRIKPTPEFDALTLVDGPLFSIYPYEINFTLTDVEYTPIKKFITIKDLYNFKNSFDWKTERKFRKMIKKVENYFPEFKTHFKNIGYFTSTKCKVVSGSDSRYPIITKHDNIVNCFTGKIQGIFIIEEKIKEIIND